MGLIRVAANAISAGFGSVTTSLDSTIWKEYFESGDMSQGILMKRGEKIVAGRGKNKYADNNLISSGSGIDVQEGQCMIIVENGAIVEFCAEPGRFTYDSSTQPSLFSGENKGLKALGREILTQWSAGGQRFATQRVYFINMGELIHTPIKWGCGDINFHHVQQYATGLMELSIRLKGNGTATIQITDPIKFFKTIGAQVAGTDGPGVIKVTDEGIMTNLRSNIVDNVAIAIETLGTEQQIAYTSIRSKGNDIKEIINRIISEEWSGLRGFGLASFSVNGSFTPSEEDMAQIRQLQSGFNATQNANLMNYDLQKGISEGFRMAGQAGQFGNAAAAAMVMGQGGGMGGIGNIQYQPQQQPQMQRPVAAPVVAAPAEDSWTCSCGRVNTGNFCAGCGSKKPAPVVEGGWTCSCGRTNGATDNFCAGCGSKKPVKKVLKCDKCGYVIPEGAGETRFCPMCGDVVTEADFV